MHRSIEGTNTGRLFGLLALVCTLVLGGCAELRDYQKQAQAEEEAALEAIEPHQTKPTEVEAAIAAGETADALKPTSPDAPGGLQPAVEQPEVSIGSGVVSPTITPLAPSGGGGSVTLNFAGADIREVIDVMLGDTLNASYIVDPAVEGSVTIRTSRPVPRSAIVPLLENILSLNGAALVAEDGIYTVLPIDAASGSVTRPTVGPGRVDRGYGINIIPLRFASADSMSTVLEPFIAPGRSLQVDNARNLLIFTGPGIEANELLGLVDLFDIDWMQGMSFGLYPLEASEPKDVVAELEQIFSQGDGGPLAGGLRLLPIERLSSVLVISPEAENVERVGEWVERLDRGSEGAGRRIYVYYLQNSRARDVADILTQVFTGGSSSSSEDFAPGELAPGLTPIDLEGGEVIEEDNVRRAQSGQPRAQRASADAIDGRTSGAVGTLASDGSDIRVIADEKKNALVVLATAAEYRMIEATLRRLDVVPLQVLIEATIAEVTLNDDLTYGLQWFFERGNNEFSLTNNLINTAPAAVIPGFNYVFATNNNQVVLSALSEVTDVKVISSPSLMVLDNESAILQVGDQVPVATSASTSNIDDLSPTVNEIELLDTGVILDVTPRVNTGGLVVMDIIQEVSDPTVTTTSNLDSPTIFQRRIESSVAVHSGETVALGGLIRDNQSEGYSGIPVLSEIPILGNLFKTTTVSDTRTELLVLITPRVVSSREDAQQVTDELRRRLSKVLPLQTLID